MNDLPWSPQQRRWRYAGRKSLLVVLVTLVAGALVTADRMGFFNRGAPAQGAGGDDLPTFDGKSFLVSHVSDGDTIDVHVPGPHPYDQRVRLLGVDTPETVKPRTPVQHFGPEASAFTKQTVLGQTVTLGLDPKRTRDIYNRLLAYVVLADGRDFCRLLIEEGYGYADPRFAHPRRSDYAKVQKQAMKDGRGLWKDVKPDDLPSYYRDSLKLPKQ